MKAFRKVKVTDRELDQLQTNVAQILGPLSKNLLVDGVLLKDIDLVYGDNKVSHKLQRKPLGWIIVDIDSAPVIYKTGWNDTTITLNTSAPAKVTFWIF